MRFHVFFTAAMSLKSQTVTLNVSKSFSSVSSEVCLASMCDRPAETSLTHDFTPSVLKIGCNGTFSPT
jgi:hypothetical protein